MFLPCLGTSFLFPSRAGVLVCWSVTAVAFLLIVDVTAYIASDTKSYFPRCCPRVSARDAVYTRNVSVRAPHLHEHVPHIGL